ncbi:restriction endonuclease subunit S [Alcanivorax sp. IO_7]|nr:restriction endonuclease subunit S [Alcanivorax sp. IO_7]
MRNSNVDKAISDDEKPVNLCNYTDVYYNDRITPDMEFMNGSATEAEIVKFQLKRDQVIITKDSEGWDDIGIPALVAQDMPEVLCGYHLSVLEPGVELDGAFLAWLCRSDPLNDQFKLGANGVTRYGLGQYPLKNSYIALPPLETQHRIAQFLDEKPPASTA